MFARTPFWWYGSQASLVPVLLEPAALAWRFGTWLRRIAATPYRSRLPVICVGNFTAGGAGKTPAAIAVAEILKSRGERPVFLTRGHGGALAGPHRVDQNKDRAADVGDEPLLLAKTAPVIVSADRKQGARLAETMNVTAIVMDDGFQNPHLAKDASIIVVDRAIGTGNGLIIPAGPLRASLSGQLARADALSPVGRGGAAEDVVARARSRRLPVFDAAIEPAGDVRWLKGKKVVAFAGIAHPEKFFLTLEIAGARVAKRVAFPDHHSFSQEDAARLLAAAVAAKALPVTTEKDLVRLDRGGAAFTALREKSRALPVRLEFADRAAVAKFLMSALERGRDA